MAIEGSQWFVRRVLRLIERSIDPTPAAIDRARADTGKPDNEPARKLRCPGHHRAGRRPRRASRWGGAACWRPTRPSGTAPKRRRIKPVMQAVIYRAGRQIAHGRRLIRGLGGNDRAAKALARRPGELFAHTACTQRSQAPARQLGESENRAQRAYPHRRADEQRRTPAQAAWWRDRRGVGQTRHQIAI